MLISVVIPTCNRPSTIGAAIDSIIGTQYEDYEIIIVDQSANDDTKQLVTSRYSNNSRVRYIHSDVMCSSDSRNVGWREALGEYIAFTDDDAFVDKNWLHSYADEIKKNHYQIGMIGGRIVPLFQTPRPHWLPEEKDFFLPSFDAGEETVPFPENCLPISVNLVASKALLESIGGFDTRLGLKNGSNTAFVTGGEDSFLGIKARAAGFPLTYLPSAVVYHPITAARLTIGFFLRRSFREGATTIAIEEAKCSHTQDQLEGHIRWHSKNLFYLISQLFKRAFLSTHQRSKAVMLTASDLAYSYGVVQYSKHLKTKLSR